MLLGEFTDTYECPGPVLREESSDILLGISNKWTIRDDFVALRLSSVHHEPRSSLARSYSQATPAFVIGTIEKSHLTTFHWVPAISTEPSITKTNPLYASGRS